MMRSLKARSISGTATPVDTRSVSAAPKSLAALLASPVLRISLPVPLARQQFLLFLLIPGAAPGSLGNRQPLLLLALRECYTPEHDEGMDASSFIAHLLSQCQAFFTQPGHLLMLSLFQTHHAQIGEDCSDAP